MQPHRSFQLISIALLTGYGLYLYFRITLIPITHDEAGTILNFASQPVWDIITFKDPVPNNHILHTLLVKWFTALFGYSELVCRLPNFVGGVIYWIFGFFLLNRLNKGHFVWTLIGLVLLICNPYLIEFFGLARGYGLSVAWMMVSLYLLVYGGRNQWYGSLLMAGVGVYTNLTLLNYFIPLCFLIVLLLLNYGEGTLRSKMGIPIVLFILVIASISLPISRMIQTDQFQYWGTRGFYTDTFLPFLNSSVMGKKYFGNATINIFQYSIFLVIILVLYSMLVMLKRKMKASLLMPEFQLGYLFLATLIYNILQNRILNVPFLNARTALLFYPLFVLAGYSMFLRFRSAIKWKVFLILPILAMALWHIKSCYNVHSAYEWWFDGDNKKVMHAIMSNYSPESYTPKIRLKCNWIFQPSLTYYTTMEYHKWIIPPPYNKVIDTAEIVDFYYISSEDKNEWFDRNYTVLQSFGWESRYLMKKNKVNQ
ncbi:MAG: hypothetical protein SH818_16335 [Saprospiraceae bacterium]|nr:hypothetical protein [Saprospiraceae bacterium]